MAVMCWKCFLIVRPPYLRKGKKAGVLYPYVPFYLKASSHEYPLTKAGEKGFFSQEKELILSGKDKFRGEESMSLSKTPHERHFQGTKFKAVRQMRN